MTLRNTSFHATKVFFFFFLTIICMMITATMSFQVTKDQKRCPSTTSTAAAKITTTTIIADNSVESVSFHSQQRRRDFLIGMPSALVVSGIAVSPAVLLPESAVAATTEEETIQTTTTTTTTTTTSSPLRKVKSALQKLRSETVRNVVVNYEYLDLKQILRLPPLSEVRKSCSSLLKQFPQCESQYRNFIVQLEAFDTMATLGLRGKIPSWEEWNGAYERTITALQGFVTAVAEEEQRQQQQQQSEG